MKLVLASNNAKKLAELRALFAPLALDLVAQGELGIAEAEEPFQTFIENALAKARAAAQACAGAALGDDSGLCVQALGGAPGVASAHFATLVRTDPNREVHRAQQDGANNAWLLEKLQGAADRRAQFVCTLVAVRSAHDPQPLVACGRWDGEILTSARGQGGFGYDALMFIPALGASVGELSSAQKNAHSHRALAGAQMRELMRQAWAL